MEAYDLYQTVFYHGWRISIEMDRHGSGRYRADWFREPGRLLPHSHHRAGGFISKKQAYEHAKSQIDKEIPAEA